MDKKEKKQIEQDQHVDTERILTLPNILSFARLTMIPFIVWLFEIEQYGWAFGMFFLSGVTDVVDGWIARTFHLVSNFGKAIDPIADKLTQVAVMLCLLPLEYWWVVGVLAFKEITIGILTLTAIRKTHKVYSAGWYGKLCTVVIYLSMFVLILWREPHPTFVLVDSILIVAAIALSFVKYFIYYTGILREFRRDGKGEQA